MSLLAALIEAVHILRIEAQAWESYEDPDSQGIIKRYTAVADVLEVEVKRRRNAGQLPWPVRACILSPDDTDV